jgi:hypothetical protein
MSRFNETKKREPVENLAGGQAYKESSELELASLVVTTFMEDKFYESGVETINRMKRLIQSVRPEFAAKLAVFARKEIGMRSVTHVMASELAKAASGTPWARDFYRSVVKRPDDVTEILSYHFAKKYKLTNAMRNGLGSALSHFSEYQMAKYRSEGKDFKLIDAVNILHPKKVSGHSAVEKLVSGFLKSSDTWESDLSAAGSDAKKKSDVWANLVLSKKIGYFALLRNLRNINEQADEATKNVACELLVDRDMIKRSLVLPFRFVTAYNIMASAPDSSRFLRAISKAMDISCCNVPKFDGKNLVILDGSGSMGQGDSSCFEKGSVFAAVLVKAFEADYVSFADTAKYISLNTEDSTIGILKEIERTRINGGTDFNAPFKLLKKKYDRIFILSDMQGWVGYYRPTKTLNTYKSKFDADPVIYSWDLNGYGTLEFPEKNTICLAGWSEKMLSVMEYIEKGESLVKAIENTPLVSDGKSYEQAE